MLGLSDGSTSQMSRSNSTPALVESQGKEKHRKTVSKTSRLNISNSGNDSLSRQQLYRSCFEMPTDQKHVKNRDFDAMQSTSPSRKMTLNIPVIGKHETSSIPSSSSCIASPQFVPSSRRSSFDQSNYPRMMANTSENLYIQNIPVINIELASTPDAQTTNNPKTSPMKSSPSNHSCLTAQLGHTQPTTPTYPNVWEPSSEILVQELSRLRQRVLCLETENTGLLMRLNQQQSILEARLGELEMRDKVNHQCHKQSHQMRRLSASRSHHSSSDSFDPYNPADSDNEDHRYSTTDDKYIGAV